MSLKNEHLSVAPPSADRIVTGLTAVAMLAMLGASQLEYSKKEYVSGYLQTSGGELRVVAPARGVVTFEVGLGASLKAGGALATVRTAETLDGGTTVLESQRSALAGKKASLQSELSLSGAALLSRAQALSAQRTMAQAAITQAEKEVTTRGQFLKLEEQRVARQRALHTQGYITKTALEQAEAELLGRKADLQNAERAVTQARSQVAALDAEWAANQAQLNSQREQLQRELRNVELASTDSLRQAGMSIVAPKAAIVAAVAANSGDTVEAGQLLAKLTPQGASLEALLLLPATASGRVKQGQTVRLQMTAYPYQTYGLVEAEITQVEQLPLLADETVLRSSGVPAGSVVVKAVARLKDVPTRIGSAALQSGMQFSAAIEVERKSFLAWMTWPLLKHFV